MHRLAFAAAAGLVMGLAGCGLSDRADAGPKIDRSFEVAGFTGLEVSGPYDVTVKVGGPLAVHANGSEKSVDAMKIGVKDGRLQISSKPHYGLNLGWWHSGPVSLVVTVPALTSASIAGSGGIKVDEVRGSSFRGEIAGSGDLKLRSIDVAEVNLSIAGSGGVQASGKARSVNYKIAGSGRIDASSLVAETAKISVAGSGEIRSRATAAAAIEVLGSGDVELTGGAKCSVTTQGSGTIHCS